MPLEAISFSSLRGFDDDKFGEMFVLFRQMALHVLNAAPSLRSARPPVAGLTEIYQRALQHRSLPDADAGTFFKQNFRPCRVQAEGPGFVTGYYEPEVDGALAPSAAFSAPILARPADLVTLSAPHTDFPDLMALRLRANGEFEPYPTRAQIENGAVNGLQPIVYLRDSVEVFLIHVQGSARVRLPDGQLLRLRYDGRNGHPYTSIGRSLITQGEIHPDQMSLAVLKDWLRQHDLGPDGQARRLMQSNQSYIFFATDPGLAESEGPIGGAGLPLVPLRSLAVDRSLWCYGLPFWLEAHLPWQGNGPESFSRLMLAHDTGSAILGAARGDIFFGTGEKAGHNAGNIRHPASFTVLLPKP